MVADKYEVVSANFLELASEQRLKILSNLNVKPNRVTVLANKLDVTPQEIHRNLERLSDSGFVKKGLNEQFHITTVGKLMLSQIPLMFFITKNQKYFESHDIGILPIKFSRRLGVLEHCKHVKGVTHVLDAWKKIYENSKVFICDILSEFPVGLDEILIERIKNDVLYRHVVSNDLAEHEDRIENLKSLGYYKLVQQDRIIRREIKSTGTIIILNEKEAGIIFPTLDGVPDLRHMFYGDGVSFQEWCLDYFEHYWKKAKKLHRNLPKKTSRRL